MAVDCDGAAPGTEPDSFDTAKGNVPSDMSSNLIDDTVSIRTVLQTPTVLT